MSDLSPDIAAFIAEHGTPYDAASDDYRRPPFAQPVKAGKNSPIYNAHSYHTKVPPEGIVPYIQHYTDPGDLVLDPFCGSGMTGVAALMSGRHALLNDLSPAAVHIATNYCTPVDVTALKREFDRIQAAVKDEFDWLYGTTCDRCGGPATIQYTIWSDVFECGRCRAPLTLWDLAVDSRTGKVSETFTCPTCGSMWKKANLRWLRSEPVITNYECHGNCKPNRGERPITDTEKQRIAEIEIAKIPYWYPTNQIDPQREQVIRDNFKKKGITSIADFYTSRNLWALARLWTEIHQIDSITQSHLRFWFTSFNWLASRMYRYRVSGGGGQQGRLTFSSLSKEQNVLKIAESKLKDILLYFSREHLRDNAVITITDSATDLPVIPDNSVDYIFTDPPFGQNLYYSDLNLLWEGWLCKFTDPTNEAIVNREKKVNAKDISDYARLMTEAFQEMFRVLKPGRWASVVFHNSDDKIWQTILDAVDVAGFELAEINSFDKQQLSFKGIRGDKGLERVTNKDIVLNLHKPGPRPQSFANGVAVNGAAKNGQRREDPETQVARVVAGFLATNPPPEQRTLQHLWNHVLYDLLSNGAVQVSMADVDDMLPHYFKQVDGRWYLRGEAVVGGRVFGIRTETDAIAWLSAILVEPKTTGELIPDWQQATYQAADSLPKTLDEILAENFWQDKRTGAWRTPTVAEREQMSAQQVITDQARARQIQRYLAGKSELQPTGVELCGWVEFAYQQELFTEATRLFDAIHEPDVDADLYRKTRKIAQVCRMRAGNISGDTQLKLLE